VAAVVERFTLVVLLLLEMVVLAAAGVEPLIIQVLVDQVEVLHLILDLQANQTQTQASPVQAEQAPVLAAAVLVELEHLVLVVLVS